MVNYVKGTNRKTFQTRLNSKKHTPSPTVWFLRNCGIAQNFSFAKAELGNFARNDFCEWLRKLLFFFAQNWCAKKEKFCVSFHKNCAKVLQMENPIWKKIFQSLSRCEAAVYLLILVLDVGSWRTSAGLKILEILNQSTYSHLFFL